MDSLEARGYAVDLLRRRLDAGWRRKSIEATVHESGIGPDDPGYFMSAGRITVPLPFPLKHGSPGSHTFKLGDLLDELDGPQGGLFG